MNKICLSVIFSCVLLLGCGNNSNPQNAAVAQPANNTKISFGIYDISRSGPNFSSLFGPAAKPEPLYQRAANTAATATVNTTRQNRDTNKPDDGEALTTKLVETSTRSDRKIVRNAELHLESAKPEEAQKKIAAIAEANAGFVVGSEQSVSDLTTNVRDSVQITLRIPSAKFDFALGEIRSSADRVIVETTKGEDVTEEFVDIAARLKAKQALETQFIEIMKRADTVEDALTVQSRLAEVRSEIEKIEGRARFLENQSALSTITVRIQTAAVFSANSAGFFYRLGDSVGRGFDVALNFTLGLVTFVIGAFPFALFVGLPSFMVCRSLWRRNTGSMSITEIAKEEIKSE